MSDDLVHRLLDAIEKAEKDVRESPECPLWSIPPSRLGARINDVLRRCEADKRTVAEWLEETKDWRDGLSEDELHQHCGHPAYEYRTTQGQRKAWDYVDEPPEKDAGWELNITSRDPEAWERFDYHEERYWRRLRPEGPEVRVVSIPYFIRNLCSAYDIDAQETT